MGLPKQGSTEQIMAKALTNETLATRISMIQDNRRAFDKKTTDALLGEAQVRLQWPSVYDCHKAGDRS
jgi:hypothetical protein